MSDTDTTFQELFHVIERDTGAERYVPVAQSRDYARAMREQGRDFDLLEDWESDQGERVAVNPEKREAFLQAARERGIAVRQKRPMWDGATTLWTDGQGGAIAVGQAKREAYQAAAKERGLAVAEIGPEPTFLDPEEADKELMGREHGGFDWGSLLDGLKFPARLAGSAAQGILALPTLAALGGEYAAAKAGLIEEGAHPVSGVGMKAIDAIERAKPEYTFAKDQSLPGRAANALMGGLEFMGALAAGGAAEQGIRAAAGAATRGAGALGATRQAAESIARGGAAAADDATAQAARAAAPKATAAEQSAMRQALADVATAIPPGTPAQEAAKTLGEAYLRRLPAAQFREGARQFAQAALRPGLWKAAPVALGALDVHRAYAQAGHSEDKAMLATLGDAALGYLLVSLGDGFGAFGGAAATTGGTRFFRALAGNAARDPNLRAALAAGAANVLGSAATGAGQAAGHLAILRGALGEEEISDADLLGAAALGGLFGAVPAAAQAIRPIRQAIAEDIATAAARAQAAAQRAARESPTVNRESLTWRPLDATDPSAPPDTPQGPNAGGVWRSPTQRDSRFTTHDSRAIAPSAMAAPVAVSDAGDILFRSGAIWRARTGDLLMPSGAVVSPQGDILTAAPPPAPQPQQPTPAQDDLFGLPPDPAQPPAPAAGQDPAGTLALYDLLREADVQVHNVPIGQIQVNRDIKQFKADADPVTGVVAGEELGGEYQAVPAKPILLLEKLDGSLEVVTGRHRLDLARRNNLPTIPANIIRMADGWTLDMARALDAYDNILDEKGSDQDFIDFFRRARIDRATAEAKGLVTRKKGRDAFDVAEYASEDLYALAMGDARMDAQTAAAIAREAPVPRAAGQRAQGWNQNIQAAVSRAVLEEGLRADDAAIMARSLRQAYAQRIRERGLEQLDLFGNDDTFILAMTVEAKFAAQQIRQIDFDLRGLKTAAGKQSGNLAARDTLIRKYRLKGPEDREGMARAIAALEEQKRRWQNYHTDPELAELAHAHAKRALRLEAIEQEAAAEATQSVARESPEGQSPAPQPAPAAEAAPANQQIGQSANQPAARSAEPRVLPAATMRDAKAHVDKLAEDKVEVSTLNGDTLRFSKQIKKAYSKAAENQSDDRAAHWAAVAALEHLCQSADHIFKEPPRNGSADIAYYHKYAAPFVHGGVGYIAKITAKEYPRQTARGVYSVEAVSLERIGDRGIHASIANGQTLDPVATDKIAQMAERVKRFLDQPALAPEAAPLAAAPESQAATLPLEPPPKRPPLGTSRALIAWQRAHALPGLPPDAVVLIQYGDFVETYESDVPALRAVTGAEPTTRYGRTLVGAPKSGLPAILEALAAQGRTVALVPRTLDQAEIRTPPATPKTPLTQDPPSAPTDSPARPYWGPNRPLPDTGKPRIDVTIGGDPTYTVEDSGLDPSAPLPDDTVVWETATLTGAGHAVAWPVRAYGKPTGIDGAALIGESGMRAIREALAKGAALAKERTALYAGIPANENAKARDRRLARTAEIEAGEAQTVQAIEAVLDRVREPAARYGTPAVGHLVHGKDKDGAMRLWRIVERGSQNSDTLLPDGTVVHTRQLDGDSHQRWVTRPDGTDTPRETWWRTRNADGTANPFTSMDADFYGDAPQTPPVEAPGGTLASPAPDGPSLAAYGLTDEQLNGPGFRPLAKGENFDTVTQGTLARRNQTARNARLGTEAAIRGRNDARKIGHTAKEGENIRAHQYAAKNVLKLYEQAEVAVRSDNYKTHGKGSAPKTYARLFAPFVFQGRTYVAVIAQYEARQNGIHAIEVLDTIEAGRLPEVTSGETQRDARPTERQPASNTHSVPQTVRPVNPATRSELTEPVIDRLIGESKRLNPRVLTLGEDGTLAETPTDAAAVLADVRAAVARFEERARAIAKYRPEPDPAALGRFTFPALPGATLDVVDGRATPTLPPGHTFPQAAALVQAVRAQLPATTRLSLQGTRSRFLGAYANPPAAQPAAPRPAETSVAPSGAGDSQSAIHDSRGSGASGLAAYRGSHRAPSRADIAGDEDDTTVPLRDWAKIVPGDTFTHPERYFGANALALESARLIARALAGKAKTITVYRAVPAGLPEARLNDGDWVTPSKAYAQTHGRHALGGDYRILAQRVAIDDLFWNGDSPAELGYDSGRNPAPDTLANPAPGAPAPQGAQPIGQSANPQISQAGAYPMRGEVTPHPANLGGAPGSPAREHARIPLALPDLVLLYKELTEGAVPRVIHNRANMASDLGRYRVGQNAIELAGRVFGIVDDSDLATLKERLRARGLFRNEDPAWCLTMPRAAIAREKQISEERLARELRALMTRRVRAMHDDLPAAKVMAHELWHLIDDQDGGLRGRGDLVGHLAALKHAAAQALPEPAFADQPALVAEAKAFIRWWRGIGQDEPYFDKPEEMYAEIGAAYFCAPEDLKARAPQCFAAWDAALARHPAALDAAQRARAYIATGGRDKRLANELAATWGREYQVALRRYRNATEGFDNSAAAWWDRILAALWDDRAPALNLLKRAVRAAKAENKRNAKDDPVAAETLAEADKRLDAMLAHATLNHVLYRRKGPNNARLYLADVKGDFLRALNAIGQDQDLARTYVELYATYHRIIELGGRPMPLGQTPASARAGLLYMLHDVGPKTYRAIARAWGVFRALYERDVIERPATAELLGPDFVNLMRQNAHYVTFRHAPTPETLAQADRRAHENPLDEAARRLLKTANPASDVAKILKPLKGSHEPIQNPLLETMRTAVAIIVAAERNQIVLDWVRALRELHAPDILERDGAHTTNNPRLGTIDFWENGQRKTLIVPRRVAAGFNDTTPDWLRSITAATRILNAALTTNNPGFVPIAQARDLYSAAYNIRGLHRWPLHWIPAAGDAAALLTQFIPPAAMRAIGEHPLGRLLLNPNTIEYWTSFGNRMARLIHSGDFRGELERARQDRLAGREAQAQQREYLVQMARRALQDGILLNMVQYRKLTYDASGWKALFDEYHLDFDEPPLDPESPLRKTLLATPRAIRALWNATGTASEIASATTKLAVYAYLNQPLTPPPAATPARRETEIVNRESRETGGVARPAPAAPLANPAPMRLANGPGGLRLVEGAAPQSKDIFGMDPAQIDALAALADQADALPPDTPWEDDALRQLARKAQIARERAKADADPHWYHALPWERRAQAAVAQTRATMGRGTDNIDTPERDALRRRIAERLYNGGSAEKGRKLFVVMGLPGSGKSSAVVKNLKAEVGDLVEVDADEAKTHLPEFQGGKNADMVHTESGKIAEDFLLRGLCFPNGDNIVFPTVGKNTQKLEHLLREAKEAGYAVYLYNVRIPIAESANRALRRYVETGRFVPPDYIVDAVGDKPDRTFAILKDRKDLVDGYADLSNDVPFGARPQTLETSRRPPAGLGQRGLSVSLDPRQGIPGQTARPGTDLGGGARGNGLVGDTLALPAPGAAPDAPRGAGQAPGPDNPIISDADADAKAILESIVWRATVLAGDPTFDIRGILLTPIELVFGPFINAALKGTFRFVQTIADTLPDARPDGRPRRRTPLLNAASYAGKIGATLAQRLILTALSTGGLVTAAALALFRAATGNPNATEQDLMDSPLGPAVRGAERLGQGYRNISPYLLQNYNTLPLYVDGDITIALTLPIADEERFPILLLDATLNKLGFPWTPNPATGPADAAANLIGAPVNSLRGQGTLIQYLHLLSPFLFNYNPYDNFRGHKILPEAEFAARWDNPAAAATIANRLIESTPLAIAWKPPQPLTPEQQASLDRTPWLGRFHATLTRAPLLSTIAGRLIRVQIGGEADRIRRLRRLDQQQALAVRLLARQNYALTQLGLPPQIPQDLPPEYAKDYFEAWFARQDEHLAARSSAHRRKRLIQDALAIRDPNLRDRALRALRHLP